MRCGGGDAQCTENERENGAFDRERWRTRKSAHRPRVEEREGALSPWPWPETAMPRESRCDLRWRSAQHGGTTSSQLISVNSPERKKIFCFSHAPQVDCEPKKHVSEFFVRFEFRRPRACTVQRMRRALCRSTALFIERYWDFIYSDNISSSW